MESAPTPLLASLVASDASGIARCAESLVSGGCVAFPTETVYGLGASALSSKAVLSIFSIKGRPLTDPLIVHVASAGAAEALVSLEGPQLAVFRCLGGALWPGPLTLVAPACAALPSCVTAGTGFVGVRVPRHATALALLQACGLPIAAPSANRFGHVSPTRASHVMDDLGHAPILVLQGSGDGAGAAVGSPAVCAVGIESTVCRVEHLPVGASSGQHTRLTILRRGGVSTEDMLAALGALGSAVEITVKGASGGSGEESQQQRRQEGAGEEGAQIAPGQLLTHYAPDIPAFLVAPKGAPLPQHEEQHPAALLRQAVVIDFGGQLKAGEASAVAYRELVTPGGGASSAARAVFEALRWAEAVPGARAVLLADPRGVDTSETAEAVRDRLFRAASGRAVSLASAGFEQCGGE